MYVLDLVAVEAVGIIVSQIGLVHESFLGPVAGTSLHWICEGCAVVRVGPNRVASIAWGALRRIVSWDIGSVGEALRHRTVASRLGQ